MPPAAASHAFIELASYETASSNNFITSSPDIRYDYIAYRCTTITPAKIHRLISFQWAMRHKPKSLLSTALKVPAVPRTHQIAILDIIAYVVRQKRLGIKLHFKTAVAESCHPHDQRKSPEALTAGNDVFLLLISRYSILFNRRHIHFT